MTFFDCTADLLGQLNGNGQEGMLQIDALPVENLWLRHCYQVIKMFEKGYDTRCYFNVRSKAARNQQLKSVKQIK